MAKATSRPLSVSGNQVTIGSRPISQHSVATAAANGAATLRTPQSRHAHIATTSSRNSTPRTTSRPPTTRKSASPARPPNRAGHEVGVRQTALNAAHQALEAGGQSRVPRSFLADALEEYFPSTLVHQALDAAVAQSGVNVDWREVLDALATLDAEPLRSPSPALASSDLDPSFPLCTSFEDGLQALYTLASDETTFAQLFGHFDTDHDGILDNTQMREFLARLIGYPNCAAAPRILIEQLVVQLPGEPAYGPQAPRCYHGRLLYRQAKVRWQLRESGGNISQSTPSAVTNVKGSGSLNEQPTTADAADPTSATIRMPLAAPLPSYGALLHPNGSTQPNYASPTEISILHLSTGVPARRENAPLAPRGGAEPLDPVHDPSDSPTPNRTVRVVSPVHSEPDLVEEYLATLRDIQTANVHDREDEVEELERSHIEFILDGQHQSPRQVVAEAPAAVSNSLKGAQSTTRSPSPRKESASVTHSPESTQAGPLQRPPARGTLDGRLEGLNLTQRRDEQEEPTMVNMLEDNGVAVSVAALPGSLSGSSASESESALHLPADMRTLRRPTPSSRGASAKSTSNGPDNVLPRPTPAQHLLNLDRSLGGVAPDKSIRMPPTLGLERPKMQPTLHTDAHYSRSLFDMSQNEREQLLANRPGAGLLLMSSLPADTHAADVLEAMRTLCATKAEKLIKACEQEDCRHTGFVTGNDMRRIINEHGLTVTKVAFRRLCHGADVIGMAGIPYRRFLRHYTPYRSHQVQLEEISRVSSGHPSRGSARSTNANNAVTFSDKPLQEIHAMVQPVIARHWQSILKACRQMDSRRKGTLLPSRFKAAVKVHFPLSEAELNSLCRHWRLGGKEVHYGKFVQHFASGTATSMQATQRAAPTLPTVNTPSSSQRGSESEFRALAARVHVPVEQNFAALRQRLKKGAISNSRTTLENVQASFASVGIELTSDDLEVIRNSLRPRSQDAGLDFNELLRRLLK